MEIQSTRIEDVKILQPRAFRDDRGYFMETWNQRTLDRLGLELRFVQDNESRSTQGTLRGIHFQRQRPQGKLVRVVSGKVFDIAVDLRAGSPTFGQWTGHELSDTNMTQLWIPPGFGHAFYVMSDVAVFNYKCTDYYQGDDQWSLRWDCPEVAIQWPLDPAVKVLLSPADRDAPGLSQLRTILGA
ncbi:MAG: dTDP-4-dehydrorhamnose 3,5-epimerase [Thiotrichales bacterium]